MGQTHGAKRCEHDLARQRSGGAQSDQESRGEPRIRRAAGLTDARAEIGAKRLTLDTIASLSHLPRLQDQRTFGRDNSNPYYDFLAYVARELPAGKVLELGTCTGACTSYLAVSRADCHVLTVDISVRPRQRRH